MPELRSPSPIDIFVGQRLRLRRQILGLTQKQVGEAIGARFQQIQKYECGANRVTVTRLWRLSQALNCPVTYFFPSRMNPLNDHQDTLTHG